MRVDAASRRMQFIESSDMFYAAGRRVYLKALFLEQLLMDFTAHPKTHENILNHLWARALARACRLKPAPTCNVFLVFSEQKPGLDFPVPLMDQRPDKKS